MRKIKIETWKARAPKFDEKGAIIGSEPVDENLLIALNNLIGSKKPEQILRGFDNFRLFNRIGKAFEKAEKSKELVLEEAEYIFLKKAVESDVPSVWGMNENLSKAIEAFMEVKEDGKSS